MLHAQCTSALSSVFPLLQGNAEALDRWGDTSAKNYCNLITYVKIIASRMWDVFETRRTLAYLYILNAVRCPYVRTYVRRPTSVTLGVASSVANDVIMRIAGLVAGCDLRARWHHNENDVTVIMAGRRYGDWRHVATGCNALAFTTRKTAHGTGRCVALRCVMNAVRGAC